MEIPLNDFCQLLSLYINIVKIEKNFPIKQELAVFKQSLVKSDHILWGRYILCSLCCTAEVLTLLQKLRIWGIVLFNRKKAQLYLTDAGNPSKCISTNPDVKPCPALRKRLNSCCKLQELHSSNQSKQYKCINQSTICQTYNLFQNKCTENSKILLFNKDLPCQEHSKAKSVFQIILSEASHTLFINW